MSTELYFRGDRHAEPSIITEDPHVVEPPSCLQEAEYHPHLSVYAVSGTFTWPELASLARLLQQRESPKASAQAVARARAEGVLRPATQDELDIYG